MGNTTHHDNLLYFLYFFFQKSVTSDYNELNVSVTHVRCVVLHWTPLCFCIVATLASGGRGWGVHVACPASVYVQIWIKWIIVLFFMTTSYSSGTRRFLFGDEHSAELYSLCPLTHFILKPNEKTKEHKTATIRIQVPTELQKTFNKTCRQRGSFVHEVCPTLHTISADFVMNRNNMTSVQRTGS